jgi:glutamate dehydrogenase (NAD(P)+)
VNGTPKGFSGGRAVTAEELLTVECDVLLPAALEGALSEKNAPDVRAKLIVEGANAPTTPEADEIFERRGIVVVPDILASAGGVTVSYFEWVQNLQQLSWDEERVNGALERTLCDSYERVAQRARTRKVALREAAYMTAIERVAKATLLRGFS